MTRLAWHFLYPGGLLRTGKAAPPDGEWLKYDGPIVPCESGLHASERAIDALRYAPPEREIVLCRVELAGTIIEHGDPVDKLAASERCILWRLDGKTTDRVLCEFARWSAAQVLHLWNAPRVVRDYLGTGNEVLRGAAGVVADSAAWDVAAGAAARDAARAAASAAAADAAAAGTAAKAAAGAAAWAAASAAAWAATGATAGVGAWDAAWEAARDAQNTELERMLNEAREAHDA